MGLYTNDKEIEDTKGIKVKRDSATNKIVEVKFDISDIDDKVLDDFWRTKENFVEIIAAEIITKARDKIDDYAEKGKLQRLMSAYLNDFDRPIESALLYDFEGYSVASLVKSLYLNNKGNHIGNYYSSLIFYVNALESNTWEFREEKKPGHFEITLYEEKKSFFGLATLKFKAVLTDFYIDLIKAIEKLESSNKNPLFIQQGRWGAKPEFFGVKDIKEDCTLYSEYVAHMKDKRNLADDFVKHSELDLVICLIH